MRRAIILLYSYASYLLGMSGLALLIALMNGWGLASMVSIQETSAVLPWFINLALLLFFGVMHSLMAQKWLKIKLRLIPAIERSTYVLITGAQLILLALFWQPLPGALWQLQAGSFAAWTLTVVSLLGWLMMLISTCIISHSDLFGLRQSWLEWRNQQYTPLPFQIRGLYKFMRHPQMTGMLIAFWFTPDMTSSRLLFNISMTLYILIGIYFEERSLIKELGTDYQRYRQQVAMLIPKKAVNHKLIE